MIFKDYYKILGLSTTKVTTDQIRTAFRIQAKKYHPDVNKEDKIAEEKFKDINEAYRVLTSVSGKKRYDRMWNSHVGKKFNKQNYEESKRDKDSIFSDFFNMFFGSTKNEVKSEKVNKKLAIKGDNVETEINVEIEEAFYGSEKKISLRTVNGKMKTFSVKVPARNNEWRKNTFIRTRKSRAKWGKKWRFIYKNKFAK